MAKIKHLDAKQFFIGATIMLVVWTFGVFISGRIPFITDYLHISEGNTTLSLVYPFLLVIFSVSFAAVCKRKSKYAMFFGSYLLLIIPSVLFVFFQIYSKLNFEFLDYVVFLLVPLIILATPAMSVFDGFFIAVYGNTRPVGFSDAHFVFCIIMIVVAILPPIVYKNLFRFSGANQPYENKSV